MASIDCKVFAALKMENEMGPEYAYKIHKNRSLGSKTFIKIQMNHK